MHVRKSNSKSSRSRSSSSSSGRPPVPEGAPSHRGPGSLVSSHPSPKAITPFGSRPGTPQPLVDETQAPGLSLQDQRSLHQSTSTVV